MGGSTEDWPGVPRPCSSELVPPTELRGAVKAFLLSRRVGNYSGRTLEMYERNLRRFADAVGGDLSACVPTKVQLYLASLEDRMKPVSRHQHYRNLKTFFSWCAEADLIAETPMRGLKMKLPRALPRVPGDEVVRELLGACADTFEGRRNKALMALLAESGLRISEALAVRIEDVSLVSRTLVVRGGKGGHDGEGYFGAETARLVRAWFTVRGKVAPEDYLFVDRKGRSLSRNHATHIFHRLSERAGLDRKVGPHALRYYAATAILRQHNNLELARRVLRHRNIATTLRYAQLMRSDVIAKYREASPLDNLQAGSRGSR